MFQAAGRANARAHPAWKCVKCCEIRRGLTMAGMERAGLVGYWKDLS